MARNTPDLLKEQQIRQLRNKGLSVREIAIRLGITTQGVYHHLNKKPKRVRVRRRRTA